MARFKQILMVVLCSLMTFFSHASIRLQQTDGQDIPLSTLNGKWILINYWASWCKSCLEEIPEFNRFYDTMKHQQVALFAVNYDALPLDKQQQLIRQLDIHYPSLKEDPANALELGDIRGVPVTYVFNPQGVLVSTLYGGQTAKTLKQAMLLEGREGGKH